jgi:hypothetical protein
MMKSRQYWGKSSYSESHIREILVAPKAILFKDHMVHAPKTKNTLYNRLCMRSCVMVTYTSSGQFPKRNVSINRSNRYTTHRTTVACTPSYFSHHYVHHTLWETERTRARDVCILEIFSHFFWTLAYAFLRLLDPVDDDSLFVVPTLQYLRNPARSEPIKQCPKSSEWAKSKNSQWSRRCCGQISVLCWYPHGGPKSFLRWHVSCSGYGTNCSTLLEVSGWMCKLYALVRPLLLQRHPDLLDMIVVTIIVYFRFHPFRSRRSMAYVAIGSEQDELIAIDSYAMHEGWNRELKTYDIMLLKLARKASATPVKVNFARNVPLVGKVEKITIIGMGSLTFGATTEPSTLQEVTVDYVPNSECAYHVGLTVDYRDLITDDMMCAEGGNSTEGYRGFCNGDSGGRCVRNGASVCLLGSSWIVLSTCRYVSGGIP